MKIKKSIHMRVIIGLEKGQKRIRCLESEFEEAAKFGIRDPFIKKRTLADLLKAYGEKAPSWWQEKASA